MDEQLGSNILTYILEELKVSSGDPHVKGKVTCVCMVVHFLLHARSLTAYEDLISFVVPLGMLPFGLRLGGDDAAWKIARTADKAVLAGLQQRVQDSPFLAVAIDDSADNKRMEQCCIVRYIMHLGRREEHLIKFHALPGGKATDADILREVAHVLCTDITDVLDGEDCHVLRCQGVKWPPSWLHCRPVVPLSCLAKRVGH
jgi:hypothetical protein